LENVTQTFKIQLEFEKGRIIITFKVLLPLFKTVIKQEQNKFKQDLAKYLFEKKIASLDAEIIILIV